MTTNEPPSRKSMRSICSITEDALVGPNDSKPWNMPRQVAMNGTMITAMATTRMMHVISSVLHLCSPSPEATIYISARSEEHTSELQSRFDLVCRLLLEKQNKNTLISMDQK